MIEQDTEPTVVLFRKYKEGDIIALFPEIDHDYEGRYCVSYQRVGQHGGADFLGTIKSTVRATEEESAPLLCELESLGYKLIVRQRATKGA